MTGPEPARSAATFAASLLRSSARGMASSATDRLLAGTGGLSDRYPPSPFLHWQRNLEARVQNLASALAVCEPRLFAHNVSWSRVAFACRGVPVEDLQASLEALAETLREQLSPDVASTVLPYLELALATGLEDGDELPTHLSLDTPLGHDAGRYLLELLEGRRREAVDVIEEILARGVEIPRLYREVLLPVQAELGRLWQLGEISVAEEHHATATTELVVALLYPRLPRQPDCGRIVLAATVDGNLHGLGIRMVSDFFEMAGWRSICLGSSLPARDVVQALRNFRADLLALSVALTEQLPSALETIQGVHDAFGEARPAILVGGAVFEGLDELHRQLGADGQADDPGEAVRLADQLLP